jgi:hypothetical protein
VFAGLVAVSMGVDDVIGVVSLLEGVGETGAVPLPGGEDDE